MKPLPPNATIGILGGGQLGRMLSLAAARLGFKTIIFDPNAQGPAALVSSAEVNADFTDKAALQDFASRVDVVTYEWENIPTEALDTLIPTTPVYPPVAALHASQDRLLEKQFLSGLGLRVAPFKNLENARDLTDILETYPQGIIKTRRFGYDGKGQMRVREGGDLQEANKLIANSPTIFESFIDFSKEISVIATRDQDGVIIAFDPGENTHRDGILRTTTVPADLPASLIQDAVLMAGRILSALEYVGTLGVEFFVTSEGLVINEIAPRVHNTGHWTQNGCLIDQFEQHIRAITGLPLGNGKRHSNIRMENLIGDDMERVASLQKDQNAALHLYGKKETRAGRKMGHVNFLL